MAEISCNLGLLALLCVSHEGLHGGFALGEVTCSAALELAAYSGSTEPLGFLTHCGTA